MRHGLLMAIGTLVLLSGNALAAVVVTTTNVDLETKEAKPSTVYADTDKLKVVSADTTIIYRGDLQRMWIVNAARRNYVEMTPETIQQLKAQMAALTGRQGAAMAQLQQRMANMPPAQRAQMEALLARQGLAGGVPGAPKQAPQVNFVKAGAGKTVARMRCDSYKKMVGGAQDEDICIATLAAAGLTAADFRVFDSFSSFAGELSSAPQAPRSDFMSWNEMNKAIGFQGIPLDTIHYESGMPSRQETVQKIERINVPANTFDLPQGLSKTEIPAPPQR